MKSICEFNVGDFIEIHHIDLLKYQKERILSMGFTKGTVIEVLRFGYKRGLVLFDVRGIMVALRDEESKFIYGIKVWSSK